MFIVCLTIFSSILSPLISAGELRESACLLCVWLFSLQSCLHFSWWVTWKCMFIVCLTIFSSILSPLQEVSYVKVHVYWVFDYFLFNLVSNSGGELRESACLLGVWIFSLFNLVSNSGGELCAKCMFIVCLTIFSSILSPLQEVSYVKVYFLIVCLTIFFSILYPLQEVSYVKVLVYCVFDYFLFNLQSCLHFSRWVTWKYMFIVCLTIFSSILSPLNSAGELRESVWLLCVWLFSLQSCLHFSLWVTWKCMFIVCLTIFSSILSPLQEVSYVKVHVYCVFDYFLFNLVSTSVGELRESAYLLCVWLFSLQSCLHFRRWVTWKCMFIGCLTIFSSILSPLQAVSYVKVHVYCVFDYFLFNLVSTSVGELGESACLLCVWLFSLQSCLHFRRWVMWKWKYLFIVCLTIFFSSILSPLQAVSYVKVWVTILKVKYVYCVFDYFLFNLVST